MKTMSSGRKRSFKLPITLLGTGMLLVSAMIFGDTGATRIVVLPGLFMIAGAVALLVVPDHK